MNSNYQCWFCGKGIKENNGVDPCSISISSNINLPVEEQTYQNFYCHIKCIKSHTHFPSLFREGFTVKND